MDGRYRRYSPHVPKYLVDRPRHLVKHCLKKISLAMSMDKTGLRMVGVGRFKHASTTVSGTKEYDIFFGNDNTMPYCTCPSWKESCYPCKHFFAIFLKFPVWNWDALSPIYINSPYLILDRGDNFNRHMREENIVEEQSDEGFVTVSSEVNCGDGLSFHDESHVSQAVASSSSVPSEVKKPKSSSSNGRACRLLLSELTRLTYDIPEEETIFAELTSQLSSMVAKLQSMQLKESGLPVRQVPFNSSNTKNYLDLPKTKKRKKTKNNNKVGYNHDLIAAHSTVKVEEVPKATNECVMEIVEGPSCDEIQFDADIITIDTDTDDDDIPTDNHQGCGLSLAELNLLAREKMLNDNMVNVAQYLLRKEFPAVSGLQSTNLGQLADFNGMSGQQFVQILHDGSLHWLAVSTIGCPSGEIALMDSLFKGTVRQHVIRQICNLMGCPSKTIKIKVMPVQQQTNGIDCGLFAIAFVQYLLREKEYPTMVAFQDLRADLHKCILKKEMESFKNSVSCVPRCKEKEIVVEIFCTCRMFWTISDNRIHGRYEL